MDEINELDTASKTLSFTVLGVWFVLPACMLWSGYTSLRNIGLDPYNFMQLTIAAGIVWHFFSTDPNNPRAEVAERLVDAIWRNVFYVGWYIQRRMGKSAPLLKGRWSG